MMDRAERSALFKALSKAVKEHVAGALQPVRSGLEDLDRRLRAIPDPQMGDKGDRGEPGPKGDPGESVTGEQGPKGDRGEPGSPGEKGDPGERGERGERGEPGRSGPTGEKGEKGEPGAPGPQGERGEKGDKGDRGEAGQPGSEGPPGRGGDKGEPGPIGACGARGEKGEKGDPGPAGEKGESIQGPAGKDGAPGRDALQIDILPAIDFSRSYPRGTYARHEGGIVRSFRDTIPGETPERAGWEVVIAGISEIEVELSKDFRSLVVHSRLTGGQATQKQFLIPAMIYRGVYKPDGEEYQLGDVATWGGSSWHCQAEKTTSRPGQNGDWKLMVKEGQRGQAGPKGEQGPPGKDGKDGRDFTQFGFTRKD